MADFHWLLSFLDERILSGLQLSHLLLQGMDLAAQRF